MITSTICGAVAGGLFVRVFLPRRDTVTPPLVLEPEVTAEQVEAAAEAILGKMWTGDAGSIGLTTYRSDWRDRIRAAFRAARLTQALKDADQ